MRPVADLFPETREVELEGERVRVSPCFVASRRGQILANSATRRVGLQRVQGEALRRVAERPCDCGASGRTAESFVQPFAVGMRIREFELRRCGPSLWFAFDLQAIASWLPPTRARHF